MLVYQAGILRTTPKQIVKRKNESELHQHLHSNITIRQANVTNEQRI